MVDTRSRSGILVGVAARLCVRSALAVMMSAALTCGPPANATPSTPDWFGDSPRGGMIVFGRLPVHAEAHRIDEQHMHMTAANGCVEDWYDVHSGETVINGIANGFFDIRVVSGEGTGCASSSRPASVNIQQTGGGNMEMVVTQTPNVATWVLHGHG